MSSIVCSRSRHKDVVLTALIIAGLGTAGPLWATDPTPQLPAASPGAALGEIVVTAQKFRQPLAKVPESITAFTSQALHAFHIKSFAAYATKTPNLSFSYGGGPTGIAADHAFIATHDLGVAPGHQPVPVQIGRAHV